MAIRFIFYRGILGVFGFLIFAGGFLCGGMKLQAGEPSPVLAKDQRSFDLAVSSAGFWNSSGKRLVDNYSPMGFRWLSSAYDSAETSQRGVRLFSLPVTQILIHLQNDRPKEVFAFFYNRGDVGELTPDQFRSVVGRCITEISNFIGRKPTPLQKDASSVGHAERVMWSTASATYLLEIAYTADARATGVPFRAEFIRLEITPFTQKQQVLEEGPVAVQTREPFVGEDRVERDLGSGDVVIKGIPMVDQGQKGYCVVASVERILRYYGVRVDANELAQLANSSATEGTSLRAMMDSLRKLSTKLQVRIQTLIRLDDRRILKILGDYNRMAKENNVDLINLEEVSDVTEIYARMDVETLLESRAKDQTNYLGFKRMINSYIDKGIPLMWSVIVGKIPEKGAVLSRPGGHMRIIIGYNEDAEEIIYSDSWGMGHESKRMSLEEAWAMTLSAAMIEPL